MRAITPAQAKARNEEETQNELETATNKLNELLGKGKASISVKFFPDAVKARLLERFLDAGWAVVLVTDPRDGDYYEFREKKHV